MDSKVVSGALRDQVRPILKAAGFTRFTGRKAWRFEATTIQVVDFQSLTSYLAAVIGTTSYSFGGSLGVYYLALRHVPWGEKESTKPPQEYQCQARRILSKSLEQPELPRPDLWYVRPDARNLSWVVADVARALDQEALSWLAYFSDLRNALEAFEARDETFHNVSIAIELLGGRLNSAARARVASALALALGEPRRALAAWERLVREPYYQRLPEFLEEAERNIAWIEKHGEGVVTKSQAGV